MPDLPPKSSAATSETIQHTLYGGMIMPIAVLAGLTWVAKRNVVPEDDEVSKPEGQSSAHHPAAPVGGKLFNLPVMICSLLIAAMVAVLFVRFIFGLG
jgi:hypothetical protein